MSIRFSIYSYVKITHLFLVWPCFRGSWFENNLIYSDIAFTQLLDFLANFLVLRRNFLKKANTFLRILIISSWKRVSLTLYFNKLDLQDTGLEIISKVNRTRALFLFVTLIKYTFKRLFNFFSCLVFSDNCLLHFIILKPC